MLQILKIVIYQDPVSRINIPDQQHLNHILFNFLFSFFQTHFVRKHKNQEDGEVKPHHRVGQGPLQIIVAEQLHVSSPSQEETLEDDDILGYESNDDDHMLEDEEELAQESYTALK